MSIVFLLIPLGLVLVGIAVWAFVWAVNHSQFEDLDKAAHSILYDDDETRASAQEKSTGDTGSGRDVDGSTEDEK